MSDLSYTKVDKKFRRLYRLEHASNILAWDEAVMMPNGGSEARIQSLTELELLRHEVLSSEELWNEILEAEVHRDSLGDEERASLKEIKRVALNAKAIEPDLVELKSIASRRCEQAWRSLRAENNWKDFLPLFEEVILRSREEAQQRSEAFRCGLYESLVELYDPGLGLEHVEKNFAKLRLELPPLIGQILERQSSWNFIPPQGPYPTAKQKDLGLEVMSILGFDFSRGRLDVSHHPFCGGVGEDVRMTTRYSEEDFTESLMGVVHETGHASYEQNRPKPWLELPVGAARGMALHESQSLLFEMQLGRSPEFLSFIAPKMKSYLDHPTHSSEFWQPSSLTKWFHRVEKGKIRTQADEATYPLHVILRFEIEKDLIEGRLEAREVPEIWNEKMRSYFGLNLSGDFRDGCMQDMHWPSGAFGYFPSYTLGAMMAAQFFGKMQAENPSLPEQVSRGDLSFIRTWLKQNIWNKASFASTEELVLRATGKDLGAEDFIAHLKRRYLS